MDGTDGTGGIADAADAADAADGVAVIVAGAVAGVASAGADAFRLHRPGGSDEPWHRLRHSRTAAGVGAAGGGR